MKKNLYKYLLLGIGAFAMASCTEDAGSEPGNDAQPSAAVYQYNVTAADGDYDPDSDVRLRVAANNKADKVYYLAEATETKTAYVAANGEDAYNKYVVEKGTPVTLTDGIADVYVTGMKHANTITVVAASANGTLTSNETSFIGYVWNTLATGALNAKYLDGTSNATWKEGLELQQREDNPSLYRIKNAFGKGFNLVLTSAGDENTESGDYFGEEGVKYATITFPATSMNVNHSKYGAISVADYVTYSATEDYAYYCRLYANHAFYAYAAYTVSAGRLAAGFIQFAPDED